MLFGNIEAVFWKPVLALLWRKGKIASEFKHTEDLKLELAKLKAEYESRLCAIEETSRAETKKPLMKAKG